jgi:hypothetical protein
VNKQKYTPMLLNKIFASYVLCRLAILHYGV